MPVQSVKNMSVIALQDFRRQIKWGLLTVLAFGFFINLLVLTTPIFMMQIFDRVLSSGSFETLLFLLIIATVALLTLGALEIVRGHALVRIGGWLERELSGPVLAASVDGALNGNVSSAQGLRDVSTLKGFLGGESIRALLDLVWTPLFIIAIYVIHPALGLACVGFAAALLAVAVLSEYAARERLSSASSIQIAAMGFAEFAVRNADTIRAMGMLQSFRSIWEDKATEGISRQRSASDISAWFKGVSRFLRMLAQALTLAVGAYYVLTNELTGGGMIAASILAARALAPVETAISGWKSLLSARSAHDRLNKLLGASEEHRDVISLPAPEGHVKVENVGFCYPRQERPVLESINIEANPGEIVGIVGNSAGGKSTFCRLLIGSLKPTSGTVRLDSAEVHRWPADSLGNHIGYLSQAIELFPGTVKLNIARMKSDEDPGRIIAAAKQAGIHDMILRLPEGYETEIGAGGTFLSGGQRQRIGLARALYGDPTVLVLDEPNSNLDSEGEACLIKALKNARRRGAVVFLVTHKESLLKITDKLLVLNRGLATKFGPSGDILSLAKARTKRQLATEQGRKGSHAAQ